MRAKLSPAYGPSGPRTQSTPNGRPLRLLYAGSIRHGSTTLDRMRALRGLGHEVVPFDTSPFFRQAPRLLRSAAWRFQVGPVVRRINEALLVLGREASFDGVWINKGTGSGPKW